MTAAKSDMDFAAKMKRLRKKNGIAMDVLAKATGLSVEYLEKIEIGAVMPPVSNIIQISSALTVDSGKFLSADETTASRGKRAESFQKRQKAYMYKTLTPDAEHKHMKGFRVTVPPESEHTGVEYKHSGEEFIYVLSGKLDVQVGKKKHRLKKDDTLHFDSSQIHKLNNPGKDKTELLVIVFTP